MLRIMPRVETPFRDFARNERRKNQRKPLKRTPAGQP
jgi:hypothetical protein